jgi:small subunit ribosomal protein S17
MARKELIGKVVSDKMKKTVVVEVARVKVHPLYKKRVWVHKRYKAHDEKEECRVGDTVIIRETRPLSKEKRWQVIAKI